MHYSTTSNLSPSNVMFKLDSITRICFIFTAWYFRLQFAHQKRYVYKYVKDSQCLHLKNIPFSELAWSRVRFSEALLPLATNCAIWSTFRGWGVIKCSLLARCCLLCVTGKRNIIRIDIFIYTRIYRRRVQSIINVRATKLVVLERCR